jgi:hypothetical protein
MKKLCLIAIFSFCILKFLLYADQFTVDPTQSNQLEQLRLQVQEQYHNQLKKNSAKYKILYRIVR